MERAEKGSFTVPASDMWNEFTRSSDHLELYVTHILKRKSDAPGLDSGAFVFYCEDAAVIKFP